MQPKQSHSQLSPFNESQTTFQMETFPNQNYFAQRSLVFKISSKLSEFRRDDVKFGLDV